MMNIIGKRFLFFLISGIVIIAGLVALAVFGLTPGIEFKSGSEITLAFDQPVEKSALVQALTDLGYPPSTTIVRQAGADYIIDLPELNDQGKNDLRAGLTDKLGAFQDGGFELVSAKAAADTVRNTIIAVLISAFFMLIYISWAFHKVPNPFRWGICAIAALTHDVLVVLGVFALLGGILGLQLDLMFVAGVLTVIGYSINDTIVVFDRIRENIKKGISNDLETVVNYSLVETMPRTLITGLGTLFVLIALMLVLGGSIQNLVVALLAGLVTGTYSAIGTASSLLVVWDKHEWGRFIHWGRGPAKTRSTAA